MDSVWKRMCVHGARIANSTAQRLGLQFNIDYVVHHDFGPDIPRKYPEYDMVVCDAKRNAEIDARLLGVSEDELRNRLAAGDVCLVAYDGDVVTGWDWYGSRPLPFNQTPFDIDFGPQRVNLYLAYTYQAYRGRGLAPDRWGYGHRIMRERGFVGTGYTVGAGNLSSLGANKRLGGMRWIGYLVYCKLGKWWFRWLSPGCRAAGVELTRQPNRPPMRWIIEEAVQKAS